MRYPPYSQTKLDRMSWVLKRSEKRGWGLSMLLPFTILAVLLAVLVKVTMTIVYNNDNISMRNTEM